MPIRPELRWLYPIDWPQISRWVRFLRAPGGCEACGRPHGRVVRHLGDGRWWDETEQTWRDGRGRQVPLACPGQGCAVAEDQGGAGAGASRPQSRPLRARHRSVRALCQRCHLLHDRPEHRRRIRLTLRRLRALGDLFLGPYSAS